ncbi:MAG: HAF repeat-containing protein [Candidatus Kapabacteria bacterium]|nr:HAF repeat-containing protein [Candidatus Kapabacteria bacterium]MDW8225327.1 HAF repeat-containing protein [Bacteroidota bacterium]
MKYAAGIGVITIVLCAEAVGQSLTWLGTGNQRYSVAFDVSADGSVVVGFLTDGAELARAFRWTAATGIQELGTFGGRGSIAHAVSANGLVIVGEADSADGATRAFRWTAQTGMMDLGTLGTSPTAAYDVSDDGSVIVGASTGGTFVPMQRAFRWQAGEMRNISGDRVGEAWGVSGDGSVVVGHMLDPTNLTITAFRWTETGMQTLGSLPDYGMSRANGVSQDGAVVVGEAMDATGARGRAYRWQYGFGMQDLGTLGGGGTNSRALDVSGDGSVVVGAAEVASGEYRAFRWTQATGMQDLNVVYASLLRDGSVLGSADGISPNGRFIVGAGYNARANRLEAYLLDTRGTTSVEDSPAASPLLRVEPQPVEGQGWVRVQHEGTLERVEVVDVLGRCVAVVGRGILTFGMASLPLPALPAGIYTVVARAGEAVAAERFVVVR